MCNLEFISGFGIGHIINIALMKEEEKSEKFSKYIKISYGQVWKLFHNDANFINGLKEGLKSNIIPHTGENLIEWLGNILQNKNIQQASHWEELLSRID